MKVNKITKFILISALLTLTIFLYSCGDNTEDLNTFASCLTENGATMYGSAYCSHCADQKEMFGESFSNINYVECTIDQDKCVEAGISAVPAWIFADGEKVEGVQSFMSLAAKTGCKMP